MIAASDLGVVAICFLVAAVLFVLAAFFGTAPDRVRSWHFWSGLGLAAFMLAFFFQRV